MSLNQFLQLLENRVDHNAVAAVWRDVLQDAALHCYLRATDIRASSYPEIKTGRLLEIVRHQDGNIVGVDENNPNIRMTLAHADIVLYVPDWRKLREHLAQMLALETSRTPIPDQIGVLHLGNWEPKKAAMFPVYMVVARSSSDLHKRTLLLVNKCKKEGILLLTPTRR